VALHYLLEAYKHLKAIALHGEAKQLLDVLKLEVDAGLIVGANGQLAKPFFAAIGQHRVWDREPKAKSIPA
jgi:catalase